MFAILSYLLLLSSVSALETRADAPVVRTSLGQIQGGTMTTFEGETIYAFRGIPYAKPSLGELRFAKPEPIEAWGDDVVLKANSDSLVCPQAGLTIFMSEDCLKINVFTKELEAALPVIVYIHGGANVAGSGHSLYEAGPQYLLDQELVFVAFNYRLGTLGFLSTGANSSYSGNYGYYDQVLALQWVQSHISNFGGDPNKVTILGMSAGSMAVSLHLASPLSKGLFQHAILMSGAATNHYNIDNVYWTRKLAWELGCPMYEPNDVVGCLRNATWQNIVEACARWEPYSFVNMKWNYEVGDSFMPKHPSELIVSGDFNRVPLLVSYTTNEFDYTGYKHLDNPYLLHDINAHFNDYAPELFLYQKEDQKSTRIKDFYLGKHVAELNAANIEDFGHIFSDSIIGHGVYRLVDMARKYTNVYYSRMSYIGQRSVFAPMTEQNKPMGVGHADDLQYVMPGSWYGTMLAKNHTDIFMMKRLTQWFANFAKDGIPLVDPEDWPSCNASHITMLFNNITTEMGDLAYAGRYALWDELFPKPNACSGAAATYRSKFCSIIILIILCCGGKFFQQCSKISGS